MKEYFLRLLQRFLIWLEADPRFQRVKELVLEAKNLKTSDGREVSGIRKRDQVLNQLLLEFPESLRRDLNYFIEQVLQLEKE